jgi:maleylacetoacetate isomerase
VRIALRFKDIKYEYVPVNLLKTEQSSSDYLAVNPNGKLPCLVVNGAQISQSIGILEYLEETFPQNSLLPKDPLQRAYARMIALTFACDIQPLQNILALNIPASEKPKWAHDVIRDGLVKVEKMLEIHAGLYCVGDSVTFADLCLVPQIYNAKRFSVDLTPFPLVQKVYDACMLLDIFTESAPEAMSDCPLPAVVA